MLQLVPSCTPLLTAERWTVLVVERNPMLRELVRRILEKQEFEVLIADDGEAALRLAAARPEGIDLLLTDIITPDLDGFEIAARLIDLHPSARVLFLTEHAQTSPWARAALRASDWRHLPRPFGQTALLTAVRDLLGTPTPQLLPPPIPFPEPTTLRLQ